MINLRRLKGIRVEQNLTQEELAKLIKMPISTYRRKENGESPITLDEAFKISKILGKNVEEIFLQAKFPNGN
ncbi:helix-turn-helix transcriptional regulator [Clostridium isatidis]|uniref:helix-turn-helix transcriptional regulator n=1 Tax=Clostridium isatidis TaxID=182773 RepID=UPI003AAF9D9E